MWRKTDPATISEDCCSKETWNLVPVKNANLRFDISLPAGWDTEQDFIKGDSISITSIDTSAYVNNGRLRIATLLQYGTSIKLDRNFDVIKESLKPISESGQITINNYEGRYLIRDEIMGQDTLKTWLLLFQNNGYAANIIAKVSKNNDSKVQLCELQQILATLKMN